MAAARTKVPAIGSAQWVVDERSQANDLVLQEVEDFGFSVRNELEWLNEHMAEIFSQNGQNKLDVFKTPGKLRGKTPYTARKKALTPRQPLVDLIAANSQRHPSVAEQSLKGNLKRTSIKSRFNVAADVDNAAPAQSPAKSPAASHLFNTLLGKGKENRESSHNGHPSGHPSPDRRPGTGHSAATVQFSQPISSQDSAPTYLDDVFSPQQTQSTQPTQATQSFRSMLSSNMGRRDTGDSFVSAKEAFPNKRVSNENLHAEYDGDAMDFEDERPAAPQRDPSEEDDHMADVEDIPDFPEPPKPADEGYSISADTHDALDLAHARAQAPEPKTIAGLYEPIMSALAGPEEAEAEHDDTVLHHDIDDQMDVDDVRSPSDTSSPVKPLVRKSSLTFAALPAREPLLAKKSMGNRTSRTSHVDQNKARGSTLGRFTGGKSLGGSSLQQTEAEPETVDINDEQSQALDEASEPAKEHNKTSSQRLLDRINMLKQQNEAPKRVSQNVMASQMSQTSSIASTVPKEAAPIAQLAQAPISTQVSQPKYPSLPAAQSEQDEDDDEDWISPIRTLAPAPNLGRPPITKSYSADVRPTPAGPTEPKPIVVSNPELPTVAESTTPTGSPAGKKYTDGPISASKAKFYSALRAAKEKIIGSSATSAQVKLDALFESPARPRMKAQDSSDEIVDSPKRTDKAGIFSHLRSPSKESLKSGKSKAPTAPSSPTKVPGSPTKAGGRRTRSSTEREKQKERDTRANQRAEDKLKEMREKEQSRATAHHQKSKSVSTKTPSASSSQQSLRQAAAKTPMAQQPQVRPGTTRTNTATSSSDTGSADDMPPPPPPKSFLPTTGHKLREPRKVEPKKLVKTNSKDTLPKAKPQKIMVPLNSSRYGQAPPPAPRHAQTTAPVAAAPVAPKPTPSSKMGPPATKPTAAAPTRPASALSSKSGASAKSATLPNKSAARVGRPPVQKQDKPVVEKAKTIAGQPRSDLAAARPMSRMQTFQDANRINVPPINPAKPPVKRAFQAEQDEPLQRPAKRPSQQSRMAPITPAHAQFSKGKIPFAEPAQPAQPSQSQFQNSEDIKLPDILTDSEDEDEDNDFEQPSWVKTPNLHELLTQQQLVDPEKIFGPIAPLNMEQVFPNKERHKRFRDRTSSAYWVNDQVTEEERRKDREAKERLYKEGAWTYNPSPRPAPRPGL